MCTDCWRNDCHLPLSFTRHPAPYYKGVGNGKVFKSYDLYMFCSNGTKQKFQHHLLDECRLVIDHGLSLVSNPPHSMTASLELNVPSV